MTDRSLANFRVVAILLVALCIIPSGSVFSESQKRPNILVIIADDLGYHDVGFQGCKDIATPHLDALAKRGLRCTNGYVSHPFCSPSRAGLLTGRYQQRFGHENNPEWLPESTVAGLPLSQTTLPQVLKAAGYRTLAIGKWHLGAHPQFHPNRRGFDYFYGFLGSGHVYLADANSSVEYKIPMNRNGKEETLTGYLTDVLGQEASQAIKANEHNPWFMYLTFNAPHTPFHLTPALMERTKHFQKGPRPLYAGLVMGMDDAIGEVCATLKNSGQEENTVIFFMSDNGGWINMTQIENTQSAKERVRAAASVGVSLTHSENTPFRGGKGQVYEGGTHVPFLVSWPGVIAQGKDYMQPVSSLDIFATVAKLADAKVPEWNTMDGVNLMPFLTGENLQSPHERLFWRTDGGSNWAIREGNWKLVKQGEQVELFDLEHDIGEAKDLSSIQPDVVIRLKRAYESWNKDNVAPIF